jgi:hypothetical protein
MPLRILLLFILLVLLLRFLTRLAGIVLTALAQPRASLSPADRERVAAAIALVRCRRCGAFVPPATARGTGDDALCRNCSGA